MQYWHEHSGDCRGEEPVNTVPVIAIDGPGGSGKGTISKEVARRLGWHLLDSGALYRLVAFQAQQRGVDLDDEPAVAALAERLDVRFDTATSEERIWLEGVDVTTAIRAEACGVAASKVAAISGVRTALTARQRSFRQPPGLVADGRDMASVIFPDAGLKIFLTASVEERANRRYKQLNGKGISVSLRALREDMADRDKRDSERPVAPLRACSDARVLDTTDLSIEEVVSTVLGWALDTWPQVIGQQQGSE